MVEKIIAPAPVPVHPQAPRREVVAEPRKVEVHRPVAAGEFPPEFLAKLARVRAGEVGIIEVRPIRRAVDPGGGASSLAQF